MKKLIASPFFVFPVLTCIFFWPLCLQILTLKNDALTYYYPVRTLIADALNNNELPLWTPYINMGYPLHADMQSGAWNPVVWMFGLLTNYSLGAFHYELLFYLACGGIGFYYLSREYGLNKYTAFIVAVAFEFSGPNLDSMQFTTCISSICYIPFVFLFFRRLLLAKKPVNNALLTAFFLYLLFTGGYPAFFIITIYLLGGYLLFAFFSSASKAAFIKRMTLQLGLLSGIFILLSLPAILSFLNHLKFIDRGKMQGLSFVLENSMPLSCMFSLISPFSTTATSSFFNTDMLMRNIYIGIIPLIFIIYSVSSSILRKSKEQRFLLIMALLLFGLAWGSHFFLRQLAYYTLPLMNTFRHPALFRFFGVMFLLLASGGAMNEWIKKPDKNELVKRIISGIGILLFLISAIIILLNFSALIPTNVHSAQLKYLISSLTFQQRLLVQLPFIFTTLAAFYLIVSTSKNPRYILALSVADLFFVTQLNMPITVVGARSFDATRILINRNAVKFPLPANTSIEKNSAQSLDTTNTIGTILPFVKRIGRNDYPITPGNLSLQEQFYESAARQEVFKNPLVYFGDEPITTINRGITITKDYSTPTTRKKDSVAQVQASVSAISITKLSANSLECTVETTSPRNLIFLQNYYPGWKMFIDGKESPVAKVNICFMGGTIPPGKHAVQFRYRPAIIVYAWYLSALTFLGLIFLFFLQIFRRILTKEH